MADIGITNNVPDGLILLNPVYSDDTLTVPGAVTYAKGTVLGRITASGKLTAYTSGAVDGSEVPISVLPLEEVFTGAGDRAIRPLISGHVRRARLVAHGVGALTASEIDALRDFTIIGLAVQQLGKLDNQ